MGEYIKGNCCLRIRRAEKESPTSSSKHHNFEVVVLSVLEMKGRSSASLFGIMISVFWFFAFHCVLVLANVEKDIFIAPQPGSIPSELAQLELATLTPSKPCIRLRLDAMFPTDTEPLGEASWFLLEDLNPGQRYEVRACWLATVRNSFSLYVDYLKRLKY